MDNNQRSDRKDKFREIIKEKIKPLIYTRKVDDEKRKITNYLALGLLAFSVIGLLWSYTASANQEEEYTTFYYFQEASFNYRIYTLPNNIFDSRVLGPGNAYITSLTDYVAVDFEYHYFGENEADLNGSFGATAFLSAYTAQEEHMVWEKEYVLLSQNTFHTTESDYTFIKKFNIPLADYLAFTEQVREETGFNPSELYLVVRGDISVEVNTEDGMITETLTPIMIIPMKGSTFTVGGQLLDEKEGGITQTRVVPAMAVLTGRALFTVMVPVTALALIFLRFLTVPSEIKAKQKKHQVTGILKKHKERIIITANGLADIPKGAITVYSFDELIKLADEVNKPILYPQPKTIENTNHFFLIYTPENVFAYGMRDNKEDAELEASRSEIVKNRK